MSAAMDEPPSSRPSFSLLSKLPIELVERIFLQYLSGKALSTLAIVLDCSVPVVVDLKEDLPVVTSHNWSKEQQQNDKDQDLEHRVRLFSLIHHVAKQRLLQSASLIESTTAQASNATIDTLTAHAVNWIRSVVEFSFVSETNRLTHMRVVSENLALVDFLELSIQQYSNVPQGLLEWPVWVGQLSVDSYVSSSRMRNTARVVITTPMQSPSFLPGCNLIDRRTPTGVFRCEPYNMIPIPPWGRVRAMSAKDGQILRPVAERLERQNQVAVPMGYHSDEILDIRVASAARARQLLESLSWTPRGAWILQDPPSTATASSTPPNPHGPEHQNPAVWNTGLVCVWQEDTMEMKSDRQYLSYVVGLLKAIERMKNR